MRLHISWHACTLLIAALASSLLNGTDNPVPNRPYEQRSPNGKYMIRMEPEGSWGEKGVGKAYEVLPDGQRHLWTVNWFAQEVELSNSGQHLVRYGPWASDSSNYSDLALAFYDEGKLLTEYRVRDLLKDRAAAVHSASHYEWRAAKQAVANGFADGGRYHLVVADKTAYNFSLETGEILQTFRDEQARSQMEIWREEEEAARERGLRAYRVSAIRPAFDEHFEVVNVRAGDWSTFRIHFDAPEWSADLKPRRPLAHASEIEAIFPMGEADRIEAALTPSELLDALKRALAHPFVARQFQGGANRLRMRVTGDRLHWDTKELTEFLEQLEHPDRHTKNLRHWANIIVDSENPRYSSAYLNTKTGELIHEDKSKWPWVPVLRDVAGELKD